MLVAMLKHPQSLIRKNRISMNIYAILSSKPHNPHYLNRYVRFISACRIAATAGEKHHICPKSSDLFPEYRSFKLNPWNKVDLTLRQHYIAHRILWKTFGGKQTQAFKLMSERIGATSSKIYETIRKAHSQSMIDNNPNRDGSGSRKQWDNATDNRRKIQSESATRRNIEYWSTRKISYEAICQWCSKIFSSKRKGRICCSYRCAAHHKHKVRRLGNKVRLETPLT